MSVVLSTPNKPSLWYSLATQNAGNIDVFCNAAQGGRCETTQPVGERYSLAVPQYGSVQAVVVDVGGGVSALALDLPNGTTLYLPTDDGQIAFLAGVGANPTNIVTSKTSYAWWRSDLNVTPASGGKASAWTDNVNGFAPSNGTSGVQPQYIVSDPNWGGRPSLRSDGTQWLEQAGGLAALLTGDDTPWAAYFIVRPETVAADGVVAALNNSAANNTHLTFVQNTVAKWAEVRGAAALVNGGTVVANTNYLLRVLFSGTTVTVIANGVTVINNAALDAASQPFDRFCFFAQRQAAGAAISILNGSICEAYYCGYQPTGGETTNLVAYFQGLYPGVS